MNEDMPDFNKPSYYIPGKDNCTRHELICYWVRTQGIPYEVLEKELAQMEADVD